jgi:hypothetical protein
VASRLDATRRLGAEETTTRRTRCRCCGSYRWHRSGPGDRRGGVTGLVRIAIVVGALGAFPLDGHRDGLLGAPSTARTAAARRGVARCGAGTRASRGVRTRKGSTWRQAPALMAAARARSRTGSSSAATTAVHTAATRANTGASVATPAAEAPDRSTRRRDETIRMSRRLPPWPGEEGSGQLNGRPLWPWSACSNGSTSPSTGRRCWPPYGRSTHHILRGSPRRRRRGNGSISRTVELRTPRSAPIRPPACRAATGERDPMIMGWSRHSRRRVPAKRSAIASTVRAGAGAGVMGAAPGAAG